MRPLYPRVAAFFGCLPLLASFWGCNSEQITVSADADDLFFVRSEGADMPVRVRGNTKSNTFILIIHGGPGASAMGDFESVTGSLRKDYAVVYWDQRNSGSSQGGWNKQYLSVEQFADDVRKTILVLKSRYGQQTSVFMCSHSWGGMIAPAFLTSGDNQTLVKGWIGADGWHNAPLSDSLSKAMQIEWATKKIAANDPDKDTWQKYLDYANANDPQADWQTEYKFTSHAHGCESLLKGEEINDFSFSPFSFSVSPVSTPSGATNIGTLTLFSGKFAESTIRKEYSSKLHVLQIPVLLIFGKYDFVCPAGLADDAIKNLTSSPSVTKVILERSGHQSMNSETDAFNAAVKVFVDQFK